MTITIIFKNGRIEEYTEKEYTDYLYIKNLFVVLRNKQWIGIYNMDSIESVEIGR